MNPPGDDPGARRLAAAAILHARRGDWAAVNELVTGWDLGERDAVLWALLAVAARHLPVDDALLSLYVMTETEHDG